jgi:four helix bundle protein
MSATWDLKQRTKEFSLRIIQVTEKLPETRANAVLSNQILRSATSVGANYRAAHVARSEKEFSAKMQIALEEADESQY